MSGPQWLGRELGQAGASSSVPQPCGAAAQLASSVSFSLQAEFLGLSHCCPIPWIPHGNKVEAGAGRAAQVVGGLGAAPPPPTVCLLLLALTAHPLSHAGHPNMGGSMQRMNPPRGMGPMGPGPQNYGSGMRPPPNSLGPAMPGINMGPGAGRPWPNPNSANSIPYSSSSPGTYVGPPGGGGPPGTPIMPSPADSTNSSDNIYTMINPVPPGGSRSNFPMGPGSDGPMGGMGGMEPHHMNGSLGSGDIDGLPKNSPNNISGISNPPGTPRDDGELGGNFLHSFQNDNYSPSMTMSV
uniref:Single stranded DNA binding protein 3 n=1 Tax=Sus scrofa TaxID=9823 RepID=A0A8D1FCM5_PIG